MSKYKRIESKEGIFRSFVEANVQAFLGYSQYKKRK